MNNLFMALYEEHKQRTRHDIYHQSLSKPTYLHCNVCLYLNAEKIAMEKAEREYYEKQESNL